MMATIAILHPSFLGGGAEAVCLWTIEALKLDYEVSLITFSDIDLDSLNMYYGTHLAASDFTVVVPYRGSRVMSAITSNSVTFTLRQHLLSAFFKRIAHNYSMCFCTFNEMDLGRRGIQYIHFPMFSVENRTARHLVNYPDSAARRILRKTTAALTGFSQAGTRRNLTLTNSQWTGRLIEQLWGIQPRVIYPPVLSIYRPKPWEERQDSFLCISRLVPEKNLEKAITIVERIRTQGYDMHLRIIAGTRSGTNRNYYDRIRKLQEDRTWLLIDHDISREALSDLLTSYKYGLHVRENEQFGIGVAEMLLAGCLPFVPEAGGQAEIVAGNPFLTFDDESDAVQKILSVLKDKELQGQLRDSLTTNYPLFSERVFMEQIRETVRAFEERIVP
jgi:glycosyltransferase involved in cell wall biosynthesis